MSDMSGPREITLDVNGCTRAAHAEPRMTLADFLRHKLGLHGTHVGCEHGVCGACTVLVDGAAVRSCLMLAVQAEGAHVRTIEGLESASGLHPLQACFSECHGLQCGFCTPGMIMTLIDYLRDEPDPGDADLREAISGNLCRCTGYQNIVKSAKAAARIMRERPATGEKA
jgi:aerobic-type carbon monoxide dehydrogenase small subunit (CoxS/CutS family)